MNKEKFYLKVLNAINNVISDDNYKGELLDFRVHTGDTEVEWFGINEADLMFGYISQLPDDTEWKAVLYINYEDDVVESDECIDKDFDM